MSNVLSAALPHSFTDVVGRQVADDYLHDESKLQIGRPTELYLPETTAQLQAVVRRCYENNRPVRVSGVRTGLTGGAVPEDGEVLISLERLKETVLLEESTVTVSAGVTLAELQHFLDEQSVTHFFPVNPTEKGASIGGVVSTNAGGSRSFHYGVMRDWVEGVEVILANGAKLELSRSAVLAHDGEIILRDGEGERSFKGEDIPKPMTKNSIGYCYNHNIDSVDLFIGAEGTLGLVSKVKLRLTARPKVRLFHFQFFPSAESAFDFVEALRREESLNTLAIEFLDKRSLEFAAQSQIARSNRLARMIGAETAAALYLEFALNSEDELESVDDQIGLLVEQAGANKEFSAAALTEGEAREIIELRHAVPEQINSLIARRRQEFPALHKIATDMAVCDQDLRWVYQLYRSTLEAENLDHAIFGHVGDNHFHVNMLPRNQDELTRAKELYRYFATEIVKRGGSVSAEHGIGRIKREFLKVQYPPSILNEMSRLKKFFDPKYLLNRGVILEYQ